MSTSDAGRKNLDLLYCPHRLSCPETPVQKHVRRYEHTKYVRLNNLNEAHIKAHIAKAAHLSPSDFETYMKTFDNLQDRRDWLYLRRGMEVYTRSLRASL